MSLPTFLHAATYMDAHTVVPRSWFHAHVLTVSVTPLIHLIVFVSEVSSRLLVMATCMFTY